MKSHIGKILEEENSKELSKSVTFIANFICNDDDYLQNPHIRSIFLKNSITSTECGLYEIPQDLLVRSGIGSDSLATSIREFHPSLARNTAAMTPNVLSQLVDAHPEVFQNLYVSLDIADSGGRSSKQYVRFADFHFDTFRKKLISEKISEFLDKNKLLLIALFLFLETVLLALFYDVCLLLGLSITFIVILIIISINQKYKRTNYSAKLHQYIVNTEGTQRNVGIS